MQKIYRLLFFIFFITLVCLSIFNITFTMNKGNMLTFFQQAPQSLELNDDLFIIIPSNDNAEYIESFGAKILKDTEKIIIADKGIIELDTFFNFNSCDIIDSKDIISTMRPKTGCLFKQVMGEKTQLDTLTVNTADKVSIESLSTIKSSGFFTDNENNKQYNFISYSFIHNNIPYYIMAIDITETQQIDLVKHLIPENFINYNIF